MINRVILNIIHKCIDIFFFIQLYFREVCKSTQYYLSLVPIYPKLQNSPGQFLFKKLPFHLGIILCEDKISLYDVSNILIWSFCIGIHHISIYDGKGFIKFNGSELYKEMNFQKKRLLKDAASCYDVTFLDGKNSCSYNISVKNGHRIENVNVYLLSQEDGKQQIIEAAKNVCKNAKREPKILEHFNNQQFNNCIKAVINVPDPELILLFGQTHGLVGYLPWHIRLSEIISQLTHHGYSLEEFRNVLQRYSKCQQRFGK